MPDALTDIERAAIEAYQGPVTKCDPRTFTRFEWNKRKQKYVAVGIDRFTPTGIAPEMPSDSDQAFRDAAREGLTATQISIRVGITRGAVYNKAKRLGVVLKRDGIPSRV